MTPDRGQANLVTLAVALVVVTAATGVAVVVADGALGGAERSPEQRRVAVSLSERLVSAPAPLTDRANVLNATRVRTLTGDRLRERYPVVGDADVRVTLDGRTVAATGEPTDGTTVRRVVLVRRERSATVAPPVAPDDNVTLPRRTDRVRIRIRPPTGTEVRTVRANGRVVLHDPGGLNGTYAVRVSRFETTRLRFESDDPIPAGNVTVTYFPARTTKALLEVTVDA